MVPVMSLWIPIIVAAVFVFIVSSILHMVFSYHEKDFDAVPDEDALMDRIRELAIPPGSYVFPLPGSKKARNTDAFKERLNRGPFGFITLYPSGPPKMGGSLAMWFGYAIIVGIFSAYVAGRALAPGAHYLSVFRFAGAVAFAGYGLALLQNSIWYKWKWSATLASVGDALIYALVTAGTFGWLWPG
jgi:hypothetical protein